MAHQKVLHLQLLDLRFQPVAEQIRSASQQPSNFQQPGPAHPQIKFAVWDQWNWDIGVAIFDAGRGIFEED